MAKTNVSKGVFSKGWHIKAYDLWKSQRGLCFWCERPINDLRQLTIDHLQPKSLGGQDHSGNLAACCISCNQILGATSLKMKIAWSRHYKKSDRLSV